MGRVIVGRVIVGRVIVGRVIVGRVNGYPLEEGPLPGLTVLSPLSNVAGSVHHSRGAQSCPALHENTGDSGDYTLLV